MNDIETNNFVDNDMDSFVNGEMSISAYPYDYYDIVSREDKIINQIDKQYVLLQNQQSLINEGFTFITFIIIILMLYFLIRNMLGRR